MAIFPNVYVAMTMISSMGIISMSISYCPYALLGQYHEIKEVFCTNINMHTYSHIFSLTDVTNKTFINFHLLKAQNFTSQ